MLSRASFGFGLAFFVFFFFAEDDALLLDDVAVEGVDAGGVLAPEPPSSLLPLPITHNAASRPTTTTATSHPRGIAARGRRERSRRPGGAIGCSSTSERRSWRSLYSSMRSLPSSPSASA